MLPIFSFVCVALSNLRASHDTAASCCPACRHLSWRSTLLKAICSLRAPYAATAYCLNSCSSGDRALSALTAPPLPIGLPLFSAPCQQPVPSPLHTINFLSLHYVLAAMQMHGLSLRFRPPLARDPPLRVLPAPPPPLTSPPQHTWTPCTTPAWATTWKLPARLRQLGRLGLPSARRASKWT